ncbi:MULTISPECIES: monovalent cation:proton antiporter-2 (CPA2) family protein [Pseudoalteromonas]|uniref:Glutathione-regulated potassium-efflux system protein KefB n=3 Tax=Pseudoalteromonas TaxID=53246 RepID=A0A290S7Z2_9GAMM|nr:MULTISPECIES: monovalent cation:proton antiporter-2 (CPA2) family protein [Pseudoalteromonas]MBH0018280.1 cation:proton antiporter [Pseudoalteromonas sp. NGC95]MBH0036154.1 cation:proton antiporter [Pseudoalteromonas sp. NZS71_1]MBH0069198.1 cation:proton antiporter [Pseudoalteromonas sp. NZS100]MBH0090633.1 cation:proton antiporter [Pseudoalteromonas sp. NSLLW218]ATC88216.1 glutathione-regulated potassium-efflux system protein KefB [Pseudoalteromonas arctica A 37-1-2]
MLEIALIYLAAAIVAVPIAKRVGLGSVLGYLIAGILIGPYALGVVGDQTDVMHFAEFGVVMMLFLVGLELQPSRLWTLRHSILGLGGLQVVLSAAAIFAFCYWFFAMHWQTALAIGLMLALSSTAIVLQSLEEKGWLKQEAGQNAFSVLLFQDIAIIPILALLPLLAFAPQTSTKEISDSIIASWPVWQQVCVSVAVIAAIIAGGKYVSAPLFRYIAQTHMREIFTIFALFLVVAIALVMQSIGLSPALGTFLAGVVLAESEFRHELEADIEPFKGLLLGLFFITVGASINFELLFNEFSTVIGLVVLLIVVKACILFALAVTFKINSKQQLLFALALAQGGEFAFVLLSVTTTLSILTPEQTSLVTLVVAVSMLIAPLLLMVYEQIQKRSSSALPEFDKPEQISTAKHVIIAGYGRFGQIMGRLLHAQGYEITVLDHSPSQIELLRRFGNTVFYGDAARQELLEAAGAHTAQMLVIAIDNPDKTIEIIKLAHKNYPQLKIVARAIDRRHAYQLLNLKVDAFNRETVDSAINLAVEALELLGNTKQDAERAGKLFRDHDRAAVLQLAALWGDDASYGVAVRQRMEDLKQVLQQDKQAQSDLNTCDSGDCEDGLTEVASKPKKPDDAHLE